MPAEFLWVSSSRGSQHFDEDTRKNIRVQAMKKAAVARKKNGTWGKQNRRQQPPVQYETNQLRLDDQEAPRRHSHIAPRAGLMRRPIVFQTSQQAQKLPSPMPIAGFELLVSNIGLNVLDLDELTFISTGPRASALLGQDPVRLKRLVARRRESYLTHIPARYGQTACLDHALQYLAQTAKGFLTSSSSTPAQDDFKLYGKALHSLQSAIDDSNGWIQADVLCAIQILSICEVLNKQMGPAAWQSHIAGAYRLIRERGPEQFNSEFEKSLIASMIGPMVSECMRLRQPCFFEEPAWQSVLQSVILSRQDFTPRCASYYLVTTIGAKIPRLFKDVYHGVVNREELASTDIKELESRSREIKAELVIWRRNYDICDATSKEPDPFSAPRADMRGETLCAGLVMQFVLCRLLGALSPSRRAPEEAEALLHANHLIRLFDDASGFNEYASFYIEQKIIFARAILDTSKIWLSGFRENEQGVAVRNPLDTIEPWKFLTWCDGMPVPEEHQNFDISL